MLNHRAALLRYVALFVLMAGPSLADEPGKDTDGPASPRKTLRLPVPDPSSAPLADLGLAEPPAGDSRPLLPVLRMAIDGYRHIRDNVWDLTNSSLRKSVIARWKTGKWSFR